MSETLSALDATFLELEQHDAGALMSIGGAMVFDPLPGAVAPNLAELQAALAERLGEIPRYSQRLSSPHVGGLSWPRWVEDQSFDIRNHVASARLGSPGGDAELCQWLGEFFSSPLDRARPLWRYVLLEGLSGGRWALAQKTHHCLVDGVGSVDVLQLMLDREPHPFGTAAAVPGEPATSGWRPWTSIAAQGPAPVAQAAATGVHAARMGLHAAVHPMEALAQARGIAELLVRDEIVGAPHTSLNMHTGPGRRFAVVRTSLAELKEIAHRLRGSVNDVVLAACTSGLRQLLIERDEPLPSRGLRAMVPVNLRTASERLALGNRVSSLFVELPVAEPIALLRFRQIVAATRRLRSSVLPAGAGAFLDLASLAPPVLHATLARTTYATRLFNVTITNVPGPQEPLYAFGAQLREVLPFVPLAAAHAVGVAVFSYHGGVSFGISADRASMPDLHVLADGIERGIEDLRALAPHHAKQTETRL
jgi:WS/DGAT/MGAT family acyltransferase